ncbi:hypothetical protein D9M71_267220 [compost metagenome]
MPPAYHSLTNTWPARRRRAQRSERLRSWVKTPATSPKSVPLAMAMASSSVSNGITASTGPNTSAWAISISGVTSRNTVGAMKCPRRPPSASPPVATTAPCSWARRHMASMPSSWPAEITGVWSGSSWPRPTLRPSAIATTSATTSSYTERCTSRRDMAEQTWPALKKMPLRTLARTCSRSASAKTSAADLPPSSITLGIACSAAVRRMLWPVPTEPVKTIWSTSRCPAR